MFSFLAIMQDSADNSEYRLEHPEGSEWHLYWNGKELPLKEAPQMYRDGGTVVAEFASEGDEERKRQILAEPVPEELGDGWVHRSVFIPANKLNIPQQLFPVKEPPAATLNGRALELIEWWIVGKRHLNGEAL